MIEMTDVVKVIVAVTALVGVFWIGRVSRNWEVGNLQRQVRDYRSRYQWKSGWSAIYGHYRLVSIDGGGRWHEVDEHNHIIGEADRDLVKHLNGLEALTSYVAAVGPIGSRPITKDDVSALERAGFTVQAPPP